MSKIKNGGLDQYGTGPFEQQQFGTARIEGVKDNANCARFTAARPYSQGQKRDPANVVFGDIYTVSG